MSYCEANDLAVGYNSPLLEHIKFAAERGQILTLIGPNGAGKSTLMKTLAAQLAPQGGTVLLDGQSLSVYAPNARARKMALMVPHTNRTELTTCFDVAAAGRYPYTGRLGILSEEDKKQVFDALHLVNAADIADRDFDKISDGQRQRVLLARAVCQKPEILFLDEPTSFLDVKGKAELMTILRHLAKEKNTAIILSLHELDLAQKLSDAVVCVSLDSVSDIMTVKDAFQKENIQKLYKMSDEEYTFLVKRSRQSLSTTFAADKNYCAAATQRARARHSVPPVRRDCFSPARPWKRSVCVHRKASLLRSRQSTVRRPKPAPYAPFAKTEETILTPRTACPSSQM